MPHSNAPEEIAASVFSAIWGGDESTAAAGVYALLDAARDPRIFHAIGTSGLDYECLFSGKLPRVLAMAAPYIVSLDPDAEFTKMLLNQGWGSSWGVFASSDAGFEDLRKHFRKFLKVVDKSTGKSLFFRFYDPRVLRVYLPTCSSDELRQVLEPVRRCFVERENPAEMAVYSLDFPVGLGGECRLVTRILRLGPNPA